MHPQHSTSSQISLQAILERVLGRSIDSYANVRIGDFPLPAVKEILSPPDALRAFLTTKEASILTELSYVEEGTYPSGCFVLDVYGNAYIHLGIHQKEQKEALLALGGANAKPAHLRLCNLDDLRDSTRQNGHLPTYYRLYS